MADYTPGPTRGLKGAFSKEGRALGALPECPALPGLPLEMSVALMCALKDGTPDTEPHECVPESGTDFISAWSWRLCFWRRVGGLWRSPGWCGGLGCGEAPVCQRALWLSSAFSPLLPARLSYCLLCGILDASAPGLGAPHTGLVGFTAVAPARHLGLVRTGVSWTLSDGLIQSLCLKVQ